jgi:hypothetical protein
MRAPRGKRNLKPPVKIMKTPKHALKLNPMKLTSHTATQDGLLLAGITIFLLMLSEIGTLF